MVARFHFDDVVFERLLQDRLLPDEQEKVTRHVERCTSCQSKLETLAEAGINLEELRGYLRKRREHADAIRAEDAASEANTIWVGFLEPSDRPDSLGRFGRYEILEVLGRGGTGIVMRGYDPSLNRQSAIKVLSPELAASAAARKRFSREAKSAAAVVHEHVVPIQTVDQEQGLPYLVMPILEGRSLEDRVRKNGPLDVKEILRIGRQIASGLAAAHAQGLVHRDVKPANILLHNGVERVVITDFGLARAVDDASMTQSGTLVGTPQYMSPEQAQGQSVDARSDLFSLGSVLYFMGTGHSPFRADTTMGVLNRITTDTPRSLTEHNPEIPQWLDQIVRRLLAKRPEDRYPSASEVEALLGQWLAHLQDPAGVPRPAEPKQAEGNGRSRIGKWITAALGGFFLLWAGITIVLETGKGTLTIECMADDVAVRIKQGGETYEQLTVMKGENDVRLAAGKYVVEIEGEHDGLIIENSEVALTRGDEAVVRILEQVGGVRVTEENQRLFRNIGIGRDGNERGVPFNPNPKMNPWDNVIPAQPLAASGPPAEQVPPAWELIHGPPHLLESNLQGTWTILTDANSSELAADLVRFYGRIEGTSSNPHVEFIKVVDQTKGIMHRLRGTYRVESNQDHNDIEIEFSQEPTPIFLKGKLFLAPNSLQINWEEKQNAQLLIASDTWHFERGIRLPNANGSGEVIYADATITATPRLFKLFEYRKKPTYTVFSQVNLTWDHYQFDPDLEVACIVGGGSPVEYDEAVAALRQRGEQIRSLVAIDTLGNFREHPLKEPFSGELLPVLDDEVIYHIVDGTVYAFSGRTGTWGELTGTGLPTLSLIDGTIKVPQPQDGFDTETINGIIVRKPDGIFVFHVEVGKWEKVEAYPEEESPGRIQHGIMGPEAGSQPFHKLLEELRSETKIQFIKTPLPVVLSYLESLHKIVIVLDHNAFDEANIPEATAVTCDFPKGTLSEGLKALLQPHGLRHVVRDGHLVITTHPKAIRETAAGTNLPAGLKSQPDKAADMQWMSRNVRVEMFAPAMIMPGEAAVFQAVVTNIGDSPLEDVCVRGIIDPNLKVLPHFGETVGEENEIIWKIPRIRPQERVVLKVQGQLQNSAKAVTNRVSVTAGGRSRIAGAAIRAASSVRVTEKTDASSTKADSDPLDNEMLAKLRGTWVQVEDFNPRPDGVIGRSGLRPMFLMFQGSKFSLARFRGKTSDYGLRGAWNVTSRDQAEFNLKMDFQVKEVGPVDIVPSDEKLDLAHSFHGTLKLEGNHLTIKVETAQNAPEFLEPLPIEWKFVRLHPVDASSNRPPAVGPDAKWVPGNAPRQHFERPQLSAVFEKLRGEWIQPQELDEEEWGGMRLMLDGDQYRLTRTHIGQGVSHGIKGTFDAAEGVDGSPNTIYFSWFAFRLDSEGNPATATSQKAADMNPNSEPGAERAMLVIESRRLFSGTYELDGNRLTLHIDKGPNAPDFVGELPATWVFGRPPVAPE